MGDTQTPTGRPSTPGKPGKPCKEPHQSVDKQKPTPSTQPCLPPRDAPHSQCVVISQERPPKALQALHGVGGKEVNEA